MRRTATGTSRGTGTTTWAFVWPQLRAQEVDAQPGGTGRFPVCPQGNETQTWAARVLVANVERSHAAFFILNVQ